MSAKSILPFLFMAILLFIQLAACAKLLDSRRVTPSSLSTTADELTERDFSAALENCRPMWVDSVTNPDTPPLNWNLAEGPGLGQLPWEQQLQLGGYVAPNGRKIDVGWTFVSYDSFRTEHGRPPSSGLEIVEWLTTNSLHLQGVDLCQLSPEDLPMWFFNFINPQTGKLYSSFDGSIPEPGGLRFRKFADAEDCKRAYGERDGWQLYTKPGYIGGYEIIVSDSDPSQVLDTAIILQRVDLEPDATSGSITTQAEQEHSHPHPH